MNKLFLLVVISTIGFSQDTVIFKMSKLYVMPCQKDTVFIAFDGTDYSGFHNRVLMDTSNCTMNVYLLRHLKGQEQIDSMVSIILRQQQIVELQQRQIENLGKTDDVLQKRILLIWQFIKETLDDFSGAFKKEKK